MGMRPKMACFYDKQKCALLLLLQCSVRECISDDVIRKVAIYTSIFNRISTRDLEYRKVDFSVGCRLLQLAS